ncbi:pentapeptide repeat-containing protein [Streptomyces sp. NBC_01381]|nr:pentapeptide repeat-containing protein [Streptomyces sp. NBC_01381]
MAHRPTAGPPGARRHRRPTRTHATRRPGEIRRRIRIRIPIDHERDVIENGSGGGDADFTNADLRGARFQDADLTGADFTNADLREANLIGANLQDASLVNADLRRASLHSANLSQAAVAGPETSFSGAKLNARTCRPKGLEPEQLKP